jgi:hypothetical protein
MLEKKTERQKKQITSYRYLNNRKRREKYTQTQRRKELTLTHIRRLRPRTNGDTDREIDRKKHRIGR